MVEQMYCPDCSAEYREGFKECSDCHVPLVEELPIDPEVLDRSEFEEIKLAHVQSDISFLQSLLESEGIEYALEGENFARLVGAMSLISPPKLLVRQEQAARVREMIADLDTNLPSPEEEEES